MLAFEATCQAMKTKQTKGEKDLETISEMKHVSIWYMYRYRKPTLLRACNRNSNNQPN